MGKSPSRDKTTGLMGGAHNTGDLMPAHCVTAAMTPASCRRGWPRLPVRLDERASLPMGGWPFLTLNLPFKPKTARSGLNLEFLSMSPSGVM